jgi:hypothetical protein
MHRYLLSVVIFSFFFTGTALAKDFKSPHKLEAGQTLSADILNEIIESLSYSEKIPTRDDFLGTWSCRRSVSFHPDEVPNVPLPYTATTEQGMIHVISGTLEFTTDGNGNYFATDQYPPILFYSFPPGITMENQAYAVLDGYLHLTYLMPDPDSPNQSATNGLERTQVSFRGDNQFELSSFHTLQMGSGIICNKTNIPPEIPEEATASTAGNTVTLSCKDRSEDETGFVILRRDSLESQWQEIGEVAPAAGTGTAVSYTDTNLPSGTYWYRVQAKNAHGRSFGSNVSKVNIP